MLSTNSLVIICEDFLSNTENSSEYSSLSEASKSESSISDMLRSSIDRSGDRALFSLSETHADLSALRAFSSVRDDDLGLRWLTVRVGDSMLALNLIWSIDNLGIDESF